MAGEKRETAGVIRSRGIGAVFEVKSGLGELVLQFGKVFFRANLADSEDIGFGCNDNPDESFHFTGWFATVPALSIDEARHREVVPDIVGEKA